MQDKLKIVYPDCRHNDKKCIDETWARSETNIQEIGGNYGEYIISYVALWYCNECKHELLFHPSSSAYTIRPESSDIKREAGE